VAALPFFSNLARLATPEAFAGLPPVCFMLRAVLAPQNILQKNCSRHLSSIFDAGNAPEVSSFALA
jgi:hypothetical protein